MKTDEAVKNFEKDLENALTSIPFPVESIAEGFPRYVSLALETKSVHGLKCEAHLYHAIVNEVDPCAISKGWNLMTIATALNAINESSPMDMKLSVRDYADMIAENERMMKLWHELVDPIKAELIEKNRPKQGNMKLIPSTNKKRNGNR